MLTALNATGTTPGDAQKLRNLANGELSATSLDAINGSQLFGTNTLLSQVGTSMATNLGGGAMYDAATGTVSAPSYSVQGSNYSNVGSAFGAVDSNLTTLTGAIRSGTVGPAQRVGTSNALVLTSLAGTAATPGAAQTLSNLANGTLSTTSTDAVNGSQLFAVDNRVTSIEGSISSITSGGGIKYFRTQSSAMDSVASGSNAVAIGGAAVSSGEGAVAIGDNASASAANSVALGNGSSDNGRSAENYTGKYSGVTNATTGTVSVGNAATGVTRVVANVADGEQGNDVVNVRQLDGAVRQANAYTDTTVSVLEKGQQTQSETISRLQNGQGGMFQVNNAEGSATPQSTGNNAIAAGAGALASGSNSVAMGTGAETTAADTVALGSNAKASEANTVALGANSIADRQNTVSVGAVGNERQITNVAAGTSGTDAVNFSQLNDTVSAASNAANAYTDSRYTSLKRDLQKQDDTLSAGIAGAMAMASLPQPYSAGASMTALGVSNYRGQSALAFGASRVSDNGRWVTKLQGSTNTQGDFGVGAGVGYQW